ncbi:MAG TPA: patatin-like phospholipase family protein [Acidimicrobiales bacterium]|nr:patatin-like phospholipase family protein [Acidimicrobiales bacterium]
MQRSLPRREPTSSAPERTAFVLAGGASLGAIEAGMLEALYERNLRADVFVGASAGALNAAFAAANPQEVDTARALQATWRAIRRRDIFPFSPLTALRALLGRSDHLVSDKALRRVIQERLGSMDRLEDARAQLGVVVTDLLEGRERVIGSGPAKPALLASAAIPGIFPPVEVDGRLYVDGGVADNTPINVAHALGATTIYVLATGVGVSLDQPPPSALAMSVHAFNLLLHTRLREDIRAFRSRVRLVVLPPPWPLAVLPSDFSHAGQLIRSGLENAREALSHPDPATAPTDHAITCLQNPTPTTPSGRT